MVRWFSNTVLGALAVAVLGGCVQSAPPRQDTYIAEPLETVLAWRVNASEEIVIRVASNGCTTKDSFDVAVTGSPSAGWAFDVALTRLHPDRCRALLPQGVALIWTKDELGLPPSARVTVLNPVDQQDAVRSRRAAGARR